ncbi:ribosomal RNA small subunit methyltransferase C [Alishewanella longhuensis]|uniref:Ribosomal RNA small subunit methyltransferase C n=1 Tax=Alishewanella longhuensis TaxID=1091037 RepID=A0ABQ3LB77_9ALTE|nr:methyltransferase [Alishewanella longhuensis]GHG77994.1 ribosomal RNA small subunit methyltransferase C [Alishewanella longhuensis]
MLANTSQLILRNQSDLTGKVLFVEPEADQLPRQLNSLTAFSCYTTDAAVQNQWQQAGSTVYFAAKPQFTEQFDTAVVFYPKSKEQLAGSLQLLSSALTDSAHIYVVGDNKGGIKSLVNHAEKLGLHAHKLDNAKHCLWFSLTGDFGSLAARQLSEFSLTLNNMSLTICSLAGVFNHGKLDVGTALLLQHLSHIQDGRVLDFACGAGIIGAALKQQVPAIELYCSDISMLAVEATQATLAANKLSGKVVAADGLPTEPASFKHIVSNPPFHTGIKTDYTISEAFIAQSVSRLQKGGTLTLVANNHLAYQQLLEQAFGNVKALAKANGFVVYQAVKS